MKFTKEQLKIIDYMYKSLKASGYDDVSISGIIGNALTESSLNPDSVSESKTYHGLFLNDKNIRLAVINKYGDYSAKSLMKYAHDWVTGADWVKLNKYTVTNAGKFKRTGYKDAHEASDAWMRLYERPVIVDKAGNVIGYQNQDDRRANATAMYDYINTNYNNIRTTTTDKGKKITIPITAYQDPPQYESTYQLPKQTNTVYPLNPNDRTIPSLDAWNGADSPSAGPNMPSLLKSTDERKRMFDLFSDNAVALGKKKTLPNLRNVLDRKMEDYIAGIMGVPDVYEEPGYTYTPMVYSPMPVFADGKQPKYADPSWNEQWLSKRLTQLLENIDTSNKMYPIDKLQVYNDAVKEYNDVKNYIDNSNDPELLKNRAQYLNEVARDYYEHLDFNHWEDNAEDELKRQMDNIRRTREYSSMLPGKNRAYYKNDPSGPFIKYRMLFKTDPSIRLHERTHSSLAYPQYNKILEINKRHGYVPKEGIDYHFYSPTEIYSLMMEIRKELGLDPGYVLNLDDVKRIRESSQGSWFKDKSDLHILDYFNEVASNTNPLFDPNNMLKAFGNTNNKIIYAKDGKLPKYGGGKGNQILEAYDKFVEDDPYHIATAMSYLPFIGTAMDIREAAKNPTAENIGYAGLSGLTDLVGGRIFAKVAGNILKAKKMAKAVKKAELDHWRNTPFYLSMPKQLAEHTVKYYAKRAADEVLDAANAAGEFMPEARLVPAASVYFPDFVANVNLLRNKLLPGHKDGKSPIRIKPENRGKLTRLKKRTGKSEALLYKTGGPAVRKMITFARNARKWKH